MFEAARDYYASPSDYAFNPHLSLDLQETAGGETKRALPNSLRAERKLHFRSGPDDRNGVTNRGCRPRPAMEDDRRFSARWAVVALASTLSWGGRAHIASTMPKNRFSANIPPDEATDRQRFSCIPERANASRASGIAIAVLKTAIRIMAAKIFGDTIPASKRTVRTISSVRPLACSRDPRPRPNDHLRR